MKKQLIFFISILLFTNLTVFAQSVPKTISGGIINGKAINLPAPAYPAAAKAVGASGSVNIQVLIDEEGNVVSASAVSGHPLLRTAAEGAARQAKFRPTQLSGQPVKVSGIITYVFNLPKPVSQNSGGLATAGDIPSTNNSMSTGSLADEKANLDYLSFGGMIGLSRKLNSDENLNSVAQVFFATFAKELESTEMPDELNFIKELPNASKEKRAEMISTFSSVLRNSASGNQIWYLNFGENTGDMVAESLIRTLSGTNGSSATKDSLAKLKVKMKSAPPDFPKNLRDSINSAIEFSEQNNLADVDILSELDDKITEIGDILFDDSEQQN